MSARAVEPGYRHALRVWWAFTWRWPVLMLVPLLPLALGVYVVKPSPAAAMNMIAWATWPMLFWAQIESLRRLLRLDFKDFSVRLLERRSHDE